MLQVNPLSVVPTAPLMNTADAGAGGGASGAGSGATGTSPGSSAGSQGASGAGGSGGVSAVSLADDTPVTIGGKTYGSFKEYQQGYVPKSEYDNVRNLTQAEIRQNLATLARQLQQQGKLPNGQQQPQQRVDPLASIRDLPIVDGKTLSTLYEQGLGPIAQAIQQLQQHVTKQNQTIQRLQGTTGTMAQRHSTQEFEQRIGTAISQLNGVDAKDPFVSELAQDVFHSYEWAKGKEDQEFQKYLADRYTAAEKHFKAKFARELNDAKNKKWQRPGGNATPSAPAANAFARATPRDIARNVFGSQQSANT